MKDAKQIKIESHIKDLWDTVFTAQQNHDIWWVYKSKDTRPKYFDTMHMYLSFFKASIHVHFVAMIIALYRLYETRLDTINIPQLVDLLEKHHPLSKEATDKINKMMEQAKPIWKKVSIIRSEVFAHLTNERNIEETFKKAKIKYSQFKDLIEISKKITNVISQDYCRSKHVYDSASKTDTISLLSDLTFYRELKRLNELEN